jgi:dihydrofolate reductase
MGKLILSIYVSVDGFISGPDGDLEALLPETPETSQYSIDLLKTADAIVLGARTYQVLESFWPTAAENPSTYPHDRPLSKQINALPKFVVSTTLQSVNWNATIIREDAATEIAELKQRFTRNLVCFGGARTARFLMRHGLIDEYQLLVCPIMLGDGTPLFEGASVERRLQLMKTSALHPSGVAALYYQPAS